MSRRERMGSRFATIPIAFAAESFSLTLGGHAQFGARGCDPPPATPPSQYYVRHSWLLSLSTGREGKGQIAPRKRPPILFLVIYYNGITYWGKAGCPRFPGSNNKFPFPLLLQLLPLPLSRENYAQICVSSPLSRRITVPRASWRLAWCTGWESASTSHNVILRILFQPLIPELLCLSPP